MKIKLIALAAFAVCGSSAFAVTAAAPAKNVALCATAPNTALGLVNYCAPDAIVNIMGATAQQPAIHALLARGTGNTVFNTSMPLAVVTSSDAGAVATSATTAGVGPKNTTIYYGYGIGTYDKKTNPNGGKRLAVVANFSNGSFSGLNAMVTSVKAAADTGTGTLFNEVLTTKLLKSDEDTAMSCAVNTTALSLLAPADVAANTAPVKCTMDAGRTLVRDYVNEMPDGKTRRGVQLVTADVAPEFAVPGVVKAAYTAKAFPSTETGVQGFGVAVNDKLLVALIARDVAAKSLESTCSSVTGFANLTPGCQPSMSRAEIAQIVTGKANAATLFGATDTTPIVYYRRTPFSGTQAASGIVFGGQGVSLALDKVLKPYATTGYNTPVLGEINATEGKGNYVWKSSETNPALTVNGMVGSGDVLSGIGLSANATSYALGLVSLEKTAAVTGSNVAKIDGKGGAWIKVDGISPNSNGTSWDAKQRVGLAKGYPVQFNTVAVKNAATKDVGQLAVVNSLVASLKDPVFDLPGVAYVPTSAETAFKATAIEKGNLAVYTRTLNAYAPLSLNK